MQDIPVASGVIGVIAGGSLMGVILIFWENGPGLVKKLFGGDLISGRSR